MKYAVILFIFSIIYSIYSPLESFADDKFTIDYDFCFFKDENPSKVYVELYYSFNQKQLLFIQKDNGYEADGKLLVEITNSATGKTVVGKVFKIPLLIQDTAGYDKSKKLVGQINMLLDTGTYKLMLTAWDFNDTTYAVKNTEEMKLSPFSSEKPELSSVELATNVSKSNDSKNVFYKNTLEVIPNPSLLYGNNMNTMFYYFEMYNLKKELIGEKYSLNISVIDSKSNEVFSELKNRTVSSLTKVETGTLDISKLATDKYKIIVNVKNEAGELLAASEKIFYIYNPKVKEQESSSSDDAGFLLSEFAKYSDKKVGDEYEKMIYILKDAQKLQFEKLSTLDSKRLFLYNYWKDNYANPVKAHKDYFERINYANKNYKSDFIDGWRTDRGRIYSIYGQYDDIDRHAFESETKAYEIWYYNSLQGGVQFVFIDNSAGIGNYILAHSTAQNELRDDSWQDKLKLKK